MDYDKQRIGVVFEGHEIAMADRAFKLATEEDLILSDSNDKELCVDEQTAVEILYGASLISETLTGIKHEFAMNSVKIMRGPIIAVLSSSREAKRADRMSRAKDQLQQSRAIGSRALEWSSFTTAIKRNLTCSEYQQRIGRTTA